MKKLIFMLLLIGFLSCPFFAQLKVTVVSQILCCTLKLFVKHNIYRCFVNGNFEQHKLWDTTKVTNEEYKIYAIALKEIHKENLIRQKQKTSFVISDKTVKSKFSTIMTIEKWEVFQRTLERKMNQLWI